MLHSHVTDEGEAYMNKIDIEVRDLKTRHP